MRDKRQEMQDVVHNMTSNATPEQLDSVLEVLSILQKQGTGNMPGQTCIR